MDSIREFTCNDCQEVTKVDWSKLRPDLDDGTSNIRVIPDGDDFKYVGICDNCGHLEEITPPVPQLKVTNVDVDKNGMAIEVTDEITNRSCWIDAWKDGNKWTYDFNQYIFHLDDDNDIIAKMFQNDIDGDDLFDCLMGAIDEHESVYDSLQESKSNSMRDRLNELKSNKFVGKFADLPENKRPMSYEDWVGTEDYIATLLDAYDVDEEWELADCNISENDVVRLYNDVYLANFEPDEEDKTVRVKIYQDVGDAEEIEISIPENTQDTDAYIERWLNGHRDNWNEYKILDEDCTQASSVDAGRVDLVGTKDKKLDEDNSQEVDGNKFKYQGYTFVPYGNIKSNRAYMRLLSRDKELDSKFSTENNTFNYDEFYQIAPMYDLFTIEELNNMIVLPASNFLFKFTGKSSDVVPANEVLSDEELSVPDERGYVGTTEDKEIVSDILSGKSYSSIASKVGYGLDNFQLYNLATLYIVTDDESVREKIYDLLEDINYHSESARLKDNPEEFRKGLLGTAKVQESKLEESNDVEIVEYKLHPSKENELWIVGYVVVDDLIYDVTAKVYLEGSKFGINEGPVSKLWIKQKDAYKPMCNYDRGWDVRPKGRDMDITNAVIDVVTNVRKEYPYEPYTESKEVKTESNTHNTLYGEWIDLLDKIPMDKLQDYMYEYDLHDEQIDGDEKPSEMILPKLIAGAKKYIVKTEESKEVKTEGVNNRLSDNIKDWYAEEFSDDDIVEEIDPDITFDDVLKALDNHENIYDLLGVGDSIVRERVFVFIDEVLDKSGYCYDKWIEDGSEASNDLVNAVKDKLTQYKKESKTESINTLLDVNKIAEFLKGAITTLTTTEYTCTWYDLDKDLAIFAGWSGGYDPNDEDYIHAKDNPEYVIEARIASTHEYMKTDLDWLTQPYDKDSGEVWDTSITLTEGSNFEEDAKWFIDEYKGIRKALDNGELLLESKKIKTELKKGQTITVIYKDKNGNEKTTYFDCDKNYDINGDQIVVAIKSLDNDIAEIVKLEENKKVKTESVSQRDLVRAGTELWRDGAYIEDTSVNGVYWCTTDGHGGYLVDTDVVPELKDYGADTSIPNIRGFEEDYEALKVLWLFPELITNEEFKNKIDLAMVTHYDGENSKFAKQFPEIGMGKKEVKTEDTADKAITYHSYKDDTPFEKNNPILLNEDTDTIPVVNPEDKDFYDGHGYIVSLYPGAGVELISFKVYCDEDVSNAIEKAVAYAEDNCKGVLLDVDDVNENAEKDLAYEKAREVLSDEERENMSYDEVVARGMEIVKELQDKDMDAFYDEIDSGYLADLIYVDATTEGAKQCYYIYNDLQVEEFNDNDKEVKTEDVDTDYRGVKGRQDIIDRLEKLKADLMNLKYVTKVEFDTDGYLDGIEGPITVVSYDGIWNAGLSTEEAYKAEKDLEAEVLKVLKDNGVNVELEEFENNDNHFYIVSYSTNWKDAKEVKTEDTAGQLSESKSTKPQKTKRRAINIKWDTDGKKVKLPTEMDIPDDLDDEDEISDYISDQTGFCHYGFDLVPELDEY